MHAPLALLHLMLLGAIEGALGAQAPLARGSVTCGMLVPAARGIAGGRAYQRDRRMSPSPAAPPRVLIVDDEARIRALLVELLADEGTLLSRWPMNRPRLPICTATQPPAVSS